MTTQKATETESRLSAIAAEIWGVPATTEYGYPLIQEGGTDSYAEGEPWYMGAPDTPGTIYGVSGRDDEWEVVFASDGVVTDGQRMDFEDACRAAAKANEEEAL